MKKNKSIAIICPQCKHKVGIYDGRSGINPKIKCRECNKLIVYDISSGKAEMKAIPQRTQGSGVRFY